VNSNGPERDCGDLRIHGRTKALSAVQVEFIRDQWATDKMNGVFRYMINGVLQFNNRHLRQLQNTRERANAARDANIDAHGVAFVVRRLARQLLAGGMVR
jgi:hypothetical protein